MKTCAAIWILTSFFLAPAAWAAGCEKAVFENVPLTVCSADPARDDIRLFWDDGTGAPLGTFDALEDKAGEITFAMNGGMYHPDRAPVGFFVEQGREVAPLVTSDGPGNFGLLPNGVLCLGDTASIHETRAFAKATPSCRFASQSGPMLVIDGRLHPRFLPKSDSTFRRNGVGVGEDGMLYAVISDAPVNFHRFARFFRDVLKTPNALYMDGKVSRLYAPGIDRNDFGFPMGPMLGVVE